MASLILGEARGWDALPGQNYRRWQYFCDDHRLCRFDADDDPLRDPSALGWIWLRNQDAWRVWSRATYEVFLPGGYWEPCLDAEAAKAAILAC